VVAATHRDLESEVAANRFRQDLYYRLHVVELALPPLRERVADLPALVDRFLEQLAARLGKNKAHMSNEAMARLARHAWPGNVRELRNVVERAAVLASGDLIEAADLGLELDEQAAAGETTLSSLPFSEAKRRAIEQFEKSYLGDALRRNAGNVSRTAEAIGMVRQSLQQKLRELGLRERPEPEE